MTDQEYAVVIYRNVFRVKDDRGYDYMQEIMEALNTLPEREQTVLEKYYRQGKTLEQVGKDIGLATSSVCSIVKRAIMKLKFRLSKVWN